MSDHAEALLRSVDEEVRASLPLSGHRSAFNPREDAALPQQYAAQGILSMTRSLPPPQMQHTG